MRKLLKYRESLNGYPIYEVWIALHSRFSLKCFLRSRPTCRNSQSKCSMICVMRVAVYKVVYKVHIYNPLVIFHVTYVIEFFFKAYNPISIYFLRTVYSG